MTLHDLGTAGISTISGRIPDDNTILNFRLLLEEHGTGEQIIKEDMLSLMDLGGLLKEVSMLHNMKTGTLRPISTGAQPDWAGTKITR